MGFRGFTTALLILIVAAVLAFGAVYSWGFWPMAIGATALGVWGIVVTHAWIDPRARVLAYACALVAVAMTAQLIVLPHDWITALSPHVDPFFAQYELGYRAPPMLPLSLDPDTTWTALLLFLSLSVLLIGLTNGLTYLRLPWLIRELMSFGVALALFGIIQQAVPTEFNSHPVVYGFWKPQTGVAHPFGPFINKNHFAGWTIMVLPLAIGYAIATFRDSRRPDAPDWQRWLVWITTADASRFALAAFAVVVMGAALVLTGSRSGLAGFVVAVLVVALALRRKVAERKHRLVAAGGLALIVVLALGMAGAGAMIARLHATPAGVEGRLVVWRDTVTIVRDFPWFGAGIGAFGRAMLVYQTSPRTSIFVQAHNDYLQIAAEGGLLVGIPALLLIAVLVRSIRRRFKRAEDDDFIHWIRVGAAAGLVGIAVQSLVEFSLQTPANTLTFVVLLAIAMHRPRRRQGTEASRAARV